MSENPYRASSSSGHPLPAREGGGRGRLVRLAQHWLLPLACGLLVPLLAVWTLDLLRGVPVSIRVPEPRMLAGLLVSALLSVRLLHLFPRLRWGWRAVFAAVLSLLLMTAMAVATGLYLLHQLGAAAPR